MVFGWFQKSAKGKGRSKADFIDTALEPVQKPAPAAEVSDEQLLKQQKAQLYDVIRECMIASGILSAGYKFKILSADQTHQQFLVLFDLASVFQSRTEQLCDMELLIQENALQRYDLVVKTCYWRVVPDPDYVRQAAAQKATPPAPDPSVQARAQLEEMFSPESQQHERENESEFAPTQFSHSLAALHGKEKTKSYVLLTGFEDTEIANSSFRPSSLKDKP
jgi:hypothetical protein